MRPLILLSAVLCLAPEADAQAWAQPEGHTYLKLSYGTGTATDQYAFDGRRKLYADNVWRNAWFDRSVYAYGEVGLTPELTLVGMLPYKRGVVVDEAFSYEYGGLGDLEVGLRWSPVNAWLPSGSSAAVNSKLSLPTGYARNQVPAPGQGNVDLTTTLDYGHGFNSWLYAQGGVGVRVRTPYYGLSTTMACEAGRDRGCVPAGEVDPGDEWVARAEVGARATSWLLVQLLGDAVWSYAEPSIYTADTSVPTSRRYLKTGVGLIVEPMDHLGISGTVMATPWGKNTVRSLDVFLGLSTDFQIWGG